MKFLHTILFATLLAAPAMAEGVGPFAAAEVVRADQLYLKRPLVVFADSPNDPNFIRQMELLAEGYPQLDERDVVVVTDTDPDARSEWRLDLRPRGFSLVIVDKDLNPVIRKPSPWTVREITAAIDKLPTRRQEVLERNPAGR
ncbi:MAG: methylmalonyl-CoA epimerase [Rhodobacterales bacterium 32-66-7]|nr:MAG: methylmalonyl-CoA epimerase [Rhodobacterales bacterium 12-65-15]OYX26688.1 MAG: methylmalonyl-CoA epimerase [Rhodobacterales bacterium 32-66-7]